MDKPRRKRHNRPILSHGQRMKFLFDLFPVILFFATFKYSEKHPDGAALWLNQLSGGDFFLPTQAPILIATVVVIVATLAQVAWVWLRHGKVDKMLWLSLGLVVVFGGLTLFFRDDSFIKWKPTLLYWAMATSIAVSSLLLKKDAMRALLGAQMELPAVVWKKLDAAWLAFFAGMGVLNLYVAFHYPTDVWVNFKLFGGIGLMLLFVIGQGLMLAKYVEEKS